MWTLVPVNICCHVIVPREWLVVIIQYIDKVRLAITVGEPWIVDFLSDKQARVTERLVMPLHDSALQVRPWNKLAKFVQKSLHSFDIAADIEADPKQYEIEMILSVRPHSVYVEPSDKKRNIYSISIWIKETQVYPPAPRFWREISLFLPILPAFHPQQIWSLRR